MHNDKVTISTHQLFAMFPDQETARKRARRRNKIQRKSSI